MDELAISVNKLSKRYLTNHEGTGNNLVDVLKEVSFEVHQGERWGVIGKNGSGKSTLLKVLSGIVKPSAGSASLYGTVSHILSVGDNFIPDLSGSENVTIFFRLNGFSKQEAAEALKRTAEFAEIGDYVYSPVKTYSDGMYLRLAFSACLQLSASILLIDEVFSAGDAAFQEKLKQHFKNKLTSAETMVMVSHNPDEIVAYCTHCIWLEKGAIKMAGTAKEVESAYYYQLASENWERDYNQPRLTTTDAAMSFSPVENDLLTVSEFKITPPAGADEITYESGVSFHISIEKKQSGLILHPAIKIYDYLMNMVLMLLPQSQTKADATMREYENKVGKMVYSTSLQPNILTFGNYYAELIFSKDATVESSFLQEAIKVPNKMHFEVKQGVIYDFAGGTDNIFIKPHCDWEITTLD